MLYDLENPLEIDPHLLEALKVEYRKEHKGKPASMNRVHFSNWVAAKFFTLAHELDDDGFYDWIDDYIKATSKTLYKRYMKSLEE